MIKLLVLAFTVFAIIAVITSWLRGRKKVSIHSPEFDAFVRRQLEVIRPLGFFRQYEGLSNDELGKKLHQRVLEEWGEEVGAMVVYPWIFASMDQDRIYWGDTEMIEGNDEYTELLNDLSRISGGRFNPTGIREEYSENRKHIQLSFNANGKLYEKRLKVDSDWIDHSVFELISEALEGTGYEFEMQDADYGQDFALVYLSREEKDTLIREARWRFLT